jgi:hypothetical protein
MAGKKGMKRSGGRTARARAWTSMRIFRVFTAPQIAATAEISMDNLWRYLRALKQWGYVEIIGTVGKAAEKGYAQKLELMQDTGPQYPVPRNNGKLWDPNTGETLGGDD